MRQQGLITICNFFIGRVLPFKFLELAKIDAKNIKDDLKDRYEYLNTDDEEDKETYLRQLKEIDENFEDCLNKIDKGFEDSLAKL